MGKTAVVTALVLANPMSGYTTGEAASSSSSSSGPAGAAGASSKVEAKVEASGDGGTGLTEGGMPRRPTTDKCLKLTLVIVSNTLVQQWEQVHL